MDDGRGHLGRRGEGGGGQMHDDAGGADGLGDDRQTAVGVLARPSGDALGHFLLEHQGEAVRQPRTSQPFDQQGGADVVGQVRHQMGRTGDQIGLLHLQRIGLDDSQAAGAVVQFGQQGNEARILFHQDHGAGVGFQQGARQAAWAGADLDHRAALERTGQTHDLAGDVQVQQEMLAKALLGRKAVSVEGFAERGKVGHTPC